MAGGLEWAARLLDRPPSDKIRVPG